MLEKIPCNAPLSAADLDERLKIELAYFASVVNVMQDRTKGEWTVNIPTMPETETVSRPSLLLQPQI